MEEASTLLVPGLVYLINKEKSEGIFSTPICRFEHLCPCYTKETFSSNSEQMFLR